MIIVSGKLTHSVKRLSTKVFFTDDQKLELEKTFLNTSSPTNLLPITPLNTL